MMFLAQWHWGTVASSCRMRRSKPWRCQRTRRSECQYGALEPVAQPEDCRCMAFERPWSRARIDPEGLAVSVDVTRERLSGLCSYKISNP